ncbi:MAG: hypothetical protein RR356_05445 [Bacteroidales bacterium]
MKKIVVILLVISGLLIDMSTYSQTNRGRVEYKRNLSESYKVSDGAMLNMTCFGDIMVVEWERNEILFSVEITAWGDNDKFAKNYAHSVITDFSNNNNHVKANISISEIRDNYQKGLEVKTLVKVPADVYMNLTAKYGNIQANTVKNDFVAEVMYGNLSFNDLQGKRNELSVKYGDLSVNKASTLILNLKYAQCLVQNVGNVTGQSAYNKLNFSNVENLNFHSRYDQMTLGSVQHMEVSAAYTNIQIAQLISSFEAPSFAYCNLSVDQLSVRFDLIKIMAQYAKIKLPLTNNHTYTADVAVKYGDIYFPCGKSISDENDRYTKILHCVSGANPKARIYIRNSYSDVKGQ